MSYPCAKCGGGDARCIRTTPSEGRILRRRECIKCGHRITTIEAMPDPKLDPIIAAVLSGSFDVSLTPKVLP